MLDARYVIDIESRSPVDLKKHGVHNYVHHPLAEITVVCILDTQTDEMYSFWLPEYGKDNLTSLMTVVEDPSGYWEALNHLIDGTARFVAHNAMFEITVLSKLFYKFLRRIGVEEECIERAKKMNFKTMTEQFDCTKELAVIQGIPEGFSSLQKVTKVLGIKEEIKDMEAQEYSAPLFYIPHENNINRFLEKEWFESKIPFSVANCTRGGKTYYIPYGADIGHHMIKYCEQDVKTCGVIYRTFTKLPLEEMRYSIMGAQLTRRMNNKGVKFDFKRVQALSQLSEYYKNIGEQYAQETYGKSILQSRALINALGKKGINISSLTPYKYREDLYKDPDKVAKLAEVHKLKDYTGISYKKLPNIIDRAYKEVVHDSLVFSGAHTGRWTSRGVQLQNFPRNNYNTETVPTLWQAVYDHNSGARQLSDTETKAAVSQLLRTTIVPHNLSNNLYITDLSQIELRMGMYLSGCLDKLKILDEGGDLYLATASKTFNKTGLTKASPERQVGKVLDLQCLYGAGPDAVRRNLFNFSDNLPEVDGKPINLHEAVNSYRRSHPNLLKTWEKYNHILNIALKTYKPIKIKLRSGRVLRFNNVRYKMVKNDSGTVDRIKVYNNNSYDIKIYGTKLWQNVVQSEARDVLLSSRSGSFSLSSPSFLFRGSTRTRNVVSRGNSPFHRIGRLFGPRQNLLHVFHSDLIRL